MRANIDKKLCTGCGICEVVCPEVFKLQGDGRKRHAVVHTEHVPETALCFCRDAHDCCKTGAITLQDERVSAAVPAARAPGPVLPQAAW